MQSAGSGWSQARATWAGMGLGEELIQRWTWVFLVGELRGAQKASLSMSHSPILPPQRSIWAMNFCSKGQSSSRAMSVKRPETPLTFLYSRGSHTLAKV